MTLLDDRLRDTVATMLRAAPGPRDFASLRVPRNLPEPTRPPTRRRNLVAAAVALVVVAAIVVTVAVVQSQRHDRSVPVGNLPVTHQTLEYRATPNELCDQAQPTTSGRYRESSIDVWTDAASHRSRMRTTYPDGSTRDLVTIGAAPVPEQIFERGNERSDLVGCGLRSGTFLDPGSDFRVATSEFAWPPPARYEPGGRSTDDRGRTALLFSATGVGSTSGPEGTATNVDRDRWYVDPGSHQLLEREVTTTWQTGAAVVYRVFYGAPGHVEVPADWFDVNGYRRLLNHTSSGTTPATTTTLGGGS